MAGPAQTDASARRTFHALDGLRWVAAVAVMARHMPDHTLLHWLPGSYLAVDLFFCLSGFVIAHAYEDRLRSGAMGLRAFLHVRVIRLWPLYLLATCIGAMLALFLCYERADGVELLPLWASSFILGLFMIPTPLWASFGGFSAFSFCSPGWSLFWEMVAGLIYALLAPMLGRRSLGLVLLIGAGLLAAACFAHGSADIGPSVTNVMTGGARVAWSFFAGVALYRFWRRGRLASWRMSFPLATCTLLLLFAIDPGEWRAAYDLVVALLVFPALILASTGEVAERWHAPMLRLGSASYALYLLHVPLMEWLQRVSERFGHPLEPYGLAGSFAIMGFAILFAFAAEVLFDKPVRAWLNRAIKPPPAVATPARALPPSPLRQTAFALSPRAVRQDRADGPRCG